MERALEPLNTNNAAELAALLGEPVGPWLARATGPPIWRNWIVRVDGQATGYVQATLGDPTEIAWVIAAPYRRRGHATAAVRAMLAELDAPQVIAHIDSANQASEAVARKLGMEPGPAREDGERRWSLPVQSGEERP